MKVWSGAPPGRRRFWLDDAPRIAANAARIVWRGASLGDSRTRHAGGPRSRTARLSAGAQADPHAVSTPGLRARLHRPDRALGVVRVRVQREPRHGAAG